MQSPKSFADASLINSNVLLCHTEEPLYENLISCRQKALGCNNNASSNPEQLCPPCYEEYKRKSTDIPITPSFMNDAADSVNTKIPNAYNKPVQNIWYDKSSSHKQLSTDEHSYKCYNDKNVAIDYDEHIYTHLKSLSNDVLSGNGKCMGVEHINTSTYSASNDSQIPVSSKLCKIAGCMNSLTVFQRYCSEHSKPQNCAMKDCDNTADENYRGLCLICWQKYEGQVKPVENEIVHLKGRPQIDHSIQMPLIQSQPTSCSKTSGKTSAKNVFETSSIIAGLPPIPKPPSHPSCHEPMQRTKACEKTSQNTFEHFSATLTSCQEQVNPQLHFQEGFKRPITTSLSNSNYSYDSRQFVPCNVQNIPRSIPDSYLHCSEGNRRLNQNPLYHGDQHGRVENNENDLSKCLFCHNHCNPNRGGYCNECHLSRTQRRMATKCVNCENIGFEKFNYLCETCYRNQIENQKYPLIPHGVHPSKGIENSATVNYDYITTEQQGCKRVGCEFFGSIEFGGYCSGCFKDNTKQQTLKDGTTRPPIYTLFY